MTDMKYYVVYSKTIPNGEIADDLIICYTMAMADRHLVQLTEMYQKMPAVKSGLEKHGIVIASGENEGVLEDLEYIIERGIHCRYSMLQALVRSKRLSVEKIMHVYA